MQNFIAVRASLVLLSSALGIFLASSARAQAASQAKAGCTVEAVDYHGWSAQLVSNRWVRLVIVPQNGGRLMQVSFAGHDYLFVNPEYLGKYFPPTSAKWFNYGGDKL